MSDSKFFPHSLNAGLKSYIRYTTNEVCMLRSHRQTKNNRKGQDNISPPKSTCPVEMFSNENYPDDLQNRELKRAIIHISKNSSLKKIQKNRLMNLE